MNIKNIWAWVLSAFSLLLGALLYERSQEKNAEAKLQDSETKQKDAALQQHTDDVSQQIKAEQEKAAQEKAAPVTPQDLLDFLNKKEGDGK